MGRHHRRSKPKSINAIDTFMRYVWQPPERVCPKCGNKSIQYYDPFFFSPIRSMMGKRRLKCPSCRFVWRPNRKEKSIIDIMKHYF